VLRDRRRCSGARQHASIALGLSAGASSSSLLRYGEVVDFEIHGIGRMRLSVRDPFKRT
jgi:hypothetical protein